MKLVKKANQDLARKFKDDYLSISAFIKTIRENHPDFQRPAADYDSWFIKDKQSGKYLRGFENWDSIDGRLIQFIITGPMFWLGLVDLAASRESVAGNTEIRITGFRISSWGLKLLNNCSPDIIDESKLKIQLSSSGIVRVPVRIERRIRYQLSRFCSWERIKSDYYIYRLRAEALDNARKQGLLVKHLVRILHDHIEIVPPNILRALRDWEKNGSQAKLEKVIILRLFKKSRYIKKASKF